MTITLPPLSNEARAAIKAAIIKHPMGRPTLRSKGWALAHATVNELAILCDELGLDPAPIIAGALAATPHTPAPMAPQASQIAPQAPSAPVQHPDTPDTLEAAQQAPQGQLDPIAEIMAGFDTILHPTVSATIAGKVRDLMQRTSAAAAAAAARAIAEAEANAAPAFAPREIVASAARTGTETLARVFGLKGFSPWHKIMVTVWAATADTPAIDPGYVFDVSTLGPIMASIERGTGVWAYGPKGAGKTELFAQIAARTGRGFTRLGFADDMDRFALLGQNKLTVNEGQTSQTWSDGGLAAPIRKPGMLVLLDEVTMAKPGFHAMFQTCLDRRILTLDETGEAIPFADGVTFAVADNTDGHGDSSGAYAGTGAANHAFLDRFPRKVAMNTPDKAMLSKIITTRTGLPLPGSAMLAEIMKASETMADQGKLSAHLSLRPVLEFARDAMSGLPLKDCAETTLLRNLPALEALTVRQHVLAQLDLKALEAIATGSSTTAPDLAGGNVQTAAGAAAVSDFGLKA